MSELRLVLIPDRATSLNSNDDVYVDLQTARVGAHALLRALTADGALAGAIDASLMVGIMEGDDRCVEYVRFSDTIAIECLGSGLIQCPDPAVN